MNQAFEPQAVAAARAILADQEPPSDILLPEVRAYSHNWEGLASAAREQVKKRSRAILMPRGRGASFELEQALDGTDHPKMRLYAIEEALRETFRLLDGIDQRDVAPHFKNMNLVYGFIDLLFREMKALMAEWDALNGGAE